MPKRPIPKAPSRRTLHLVDLDNLVAGPSNAASVPAAMSRYLEASSFTPGDHLVVAAEVTLAATALFEMPAGTRFLVGWGPDGADRRLLDADDPHHIAARYDRLVIGSGDHCFTEIAAAVRDLGRAVTVIGLQGAISLALGRVATSVRMLPRPMPV